MASSLLDEIERDALDVNVPVATALRKCVALGGRSGSEKLRDWAVLELQGYKNLDETPLPDYRVVFAPIQLDGFTINAHVTQQTISARELPDFVHEQITESVELRQGAGELEELLKRGSPDGGAIKLGLPSGAEIARYMNIELQDQYSRIERLYWAVSPTAVGGVLDQIRTSLVQLVAEIRAQMPNVKDVPSAEAADNAVQVVVHGKKARVAVSSAQASAPFSTATVEPEPEPGFWTTGRRIGGAAVGLATIAGTVFAAIQLF